MERKPISLDPTRNNQSSDRLLNLIETLSQQKEPIRLCDLARMLQMPPSTALRFLSTLQSRNYAVQDPITGRYSLTNKWCRLADNVRGNQNLRAVALPFMTGFSQLYGETISLAVAQQLSVLYVESVEGEKKTLHTSRLVGTLVPMHCTSEGKLLLLSFDSHTLNRMIVYKGLAALTPHTLTLRQQLLVELEQIRSLGYAREDEEFEMGVCSIAAPVRDYQGQIIAACGVSGPKNRMTDSIIQNMLPSLLYITRQISMKFGWSPNENLEAETSEERQT